MPRHVTEVGTHHINIDGYAHIAGNFLISDGYLALTPVDAGPVSTSLDGYLYVSELDGYSELFYMDNYGLEVQVTSKGEVHDVHGYGEMYISSSAGTTTQQIPTYTKLAGTYADGYLSDFTHNTGTLTYVGSEAGVFELNAQLSLSSTNGDVFRFRIAINGNTIAKTETRAFVSDFFLAGQVQCINLNVLVELNPSDTIEIHTARESAAAATLTALTMSIMLHLVN